MNDQQETPFAEHTETEPIETILFASDLDGTLIGDQAALDEFARYIADLRSRNFPIRIVYATGRSYELYRQVAQEHGLPEPDALILAVGTELYIDGMLDEMWRSRVGEFDKEALHAVAGSLPGMNLQPESEQRDYKLSYFCEDPEVVEELRSKLDGRNVDVVYSQQLYVDILPHGINKGTAVRHLADMWQAGEVVCAGDSGNDIDMLRVADRAIIVANAKPELTEQLRTFDNSYYVATKPMAAGVIDGLNKYLHR